MTKIWRQVAPGSIDDDFDDLEDLEDEEDVRWGPDELGEEEDEDGG